MELPLVSMSNKKLGQKRTETQNCFEPPFRSFFGEIHALHFPIANYPSWHTAAPLTRTKVTRRFFLGGLRGKHSKLPFKFRQLDFDFRDFSGFKLMEINSNDCFSGRSK